MAEMLSKTWHDFLLHSPALDFIRIMPSCSSNLQILFMFLVHVGSLVASCRPAPSNFSTCFSEEESRKAQPRPGESAITRSHWTQIPCVVTLDICIPFRQRKCVAEP